MKISGNEIDLEKEEIMFSTADILAVALSGIHQFDKAEASAFIGTMLKAYCEKYDKTLAETCMELCKVDAQITALRERFKI